MDDEVRRGNVEILAGKGDGWVVVSGCPGLGFECFSWRKSYILGKSSQIDVILMRVYMFLLVFDGLCLLSP